MKIAAIALNTFREAIRNKIVYSVVLFAVILVAVSALFGSVTIGDTVHVIKDFGLFSLSFFGAIITIIVGVSLLNKELKQKTVYNILSKPVARWQFVVGKHLGLSATIAFLISLMGCGLVVFVGFYEQSIDWRLFQGVFFTVLESVVIAAVAIFFSSLVVTTTLTGLFTLGTYLAGRSISYLQYFLEKEENYNPGLAAVVRVLDKILPDLSLFNINDSLVYGHTVGIDHLLRATLYAGGYSAVALTLAAMIFARRELT